MILLSYPCFFGQFQDKFEEKLVLLKSKNMEEQVKDSTLVIFTGGEDVNPSLYGEGNIYSEYFNGRDSMEYDLLTLSLRYKKPILGTCRGLQLINVFFGGTLYQDITWGHSNAMFKWRSKILSGLFPLTNSMHHQGIKTLATDFIPLGNTSDELIEAIFQPKLNILAFQFHPELIHSEFWKKMLDPINFYKELETELCV